MKCSKAIRRCLQLAVTAGALPLVLSDAGMAEDRKCFNQWALAAPVVASEGLLSVEKLTPLAEKQLGGTVVKVKLCETNGAYHYKVIVRDKNGKLNSVILDAKSPF